MKRSTGIIILLLITVAVLVAVVEKQIKQLQTADRYIEEQRLYIGRLEGAVLPKDKAVRMGFEVTAYCPCVKCCGKTDRIAASGYFIRPGEKAIAAPPEIPFGTKISVPGYGVAVVRDRGGAIKGSCLDVFFETHQEALQWGRQKLLVEIVEAEK